MKLLTLNTHSIIDESYEFKIETLTKAIIKYAPDIIALQEVMQLIDAKKADFTPNLKAVGEIPLKQSNFALNVLNSLKSHKLDYHGVFLGIKKAYNKYDEGLAILSSKEIKTVEITQLTPFCDYNNWKTRFALGAFIGDYWFYSLHFNWENDNDSPFEKEWNQLVYTTKSKKNVWLMGDFNLTPNSKGYELITKNYYDTYHLAKEIDNGITVKGEIDGWENQNENKRIDYIFTSKPTEINSSKVIFNGKNEQIISDHFGILLKKE
jgi:maltose 6'-phosphate phosphatase